jgi:hypothetical protein
MRRQPFTSPGTFLVLISLRGCVDPRAIVRLTQPRIQWLPGALSPGVKRPGSETDHSPPASAEAKKN